VPVLVPEPDTVALAVLVSVLLKGLVTVLVTVTTLVPDANWLEVAVAVLPCACGHEV
jgi:hypothetical protein